MADFSWTDPQTASSLAGTNVEVLWISETIVVAVWVETNTTFKCAVYSGSSGTLTHLTTQTLFSDYIGVFPIQLAKVRDNMFVLAYTEILGLRTVPLRSLTWNGTIIIDNGQIAILAAQQYRYAAVCNIGEDEIMLWGTRFDLANIIASMHCSYNGVSWDVSAATSITPTLTSSNNRACSVADNKGVLIWNKAPDLDGQVHGFSTTSGGGTNIVALDGTRDISFVSVCKIDDNKIICCCRSANGDRVGNAYAITFEDELNPYKPTVGTAYEFHSGDARNNYCTRIDDTHFIVVFQDYDDGSKGKSKYCTVDWNTLSITANDAEYFSENSIGGSGSNGIGMDSNSNGIIVIAYRDDDDNSYIKVLLGEIPEANAALEVTEITDGILSAEEITSLYTIQEIEYLYNILGSSSTNSVLTCTEIKNLYAIKESDLYSTVALAEE